jgi:sporulation protein YlmC with PRC-barrel domain
MNKLFLTAVSTLAIATAMPALASAETSMNKNTRAGVNMDAEIERTHNQQDNAVVTEQELEQTWNNTKENVREGANSLGNAVGNMVDDTTAAVSGIGSTDAEMNAAINSEMTANNLIGKTVVNSQGDAVASVKDIIIDRNGNATHVILSDGEWMGLGKTAAYDFSILNNMDADGNIVASLTEEQIDRAANFSYTETNQEDVVVMPASSYSVAQLLDAELMAQDNEALAEVDNVSFTGSKADQIILGYNKLLGMGGEQMALDFKSARLSKSTNSDIDLSLGAADTAAFKARINADAELENK